MIRRILWGVQEFIKRILRKFGIEVARHYPTKNSYIPCPPYAYSTYAPWREKNFLDKYTRVSERTSVREDRSYILCQFSQHCLNLDGDFAECGVYRGGSAYLIAEILEKQPRCFDVFDTFTGMPGTVKGDSSGHVAGDFGDTSLSSVQKFLGHFSFIKYHAGTIPQTFKNLEKKRFAFVHIDTDVYQSVMDCCIFFYDRVVKGGIIVFDDYGFQQYEFSARKAVDEFFKNKIEIPTSLHTGQCFIIKL